MTYCLVLMNSALHCTACRDAMSHKLLLMLLSDRFKEQRKSIILKLIIKYCHSASIIFNILFVILLSCHVMSCHVMSCHVMSTGDLTGGRDCVNRAKELDPEFCDVGYQEAVLKVT
jgi:hypothetical protein